MTPILTPEQISSFPVEHLSPSSIRKYLENPHAFFKNYVRYEFDQGKSPSLIEGECLHRLLSLYYDGLTKAPKYREKFSWEKKLDVLIEELFSDEAVTKVEWGKTGSIEKSKETLHNAAEFYFSDLPMIDHVVSVEERYLTDFEDLNNDPMPIALKGFTDLVTSEEEDYIIRDHKFVSFFTDPESVGDMAKYELAACPYFFLVRKRYGKNPVRMVFDEVKKSKNKDGTPQRKEIVIAFEPRLLNHWLEIYKRVVKQLAGIPLIDQTTGTLQFLPNPYAQFGEESWIDFCEEVDEGRVWTFDAIKEIRASRFARPEEVEALF